MDAIQNLQGKIEKALPQAFSWFGDHWLMVALVIVGVWLVCAFVSAMDRPQWAPRLPRQPIDPAGLWFMIGVGVFIVIVMGLIFAGVR